MKTCFILITLLFSCSSWSEAPAKAETKIETLLRLSRTQSFESLASDLYGKELMEKKDQFPKEHLDIIKTAGERTAKGYNLQSKVTAALEAALTLRDQAEVEAFFKDPKNIKILEAIEKQKEMYLSVSDGVYGPFITSFLQTQPANSPRRAYLYFIDQESLHDADLTALQLKIETLIKTEIGNLGVAKARKKDVNAEIQSVEAKITSVQIEQKLDEMTFFYKDISTQDVRDFLVRIRSPGVAKFYQTIYLTVSDGMLELAKKFVLNLKEVHREKVRQNI